MYPYLIAFPQLVNGTDPFSVPGNISVPAIKGPLWVEQGVPGSQQLELLVFALQAKPDGAVYLLDQQRQLLVSHLEQSRLADPAARLRARAARRISASAPVAGPVVQSKLTRTHA